MIPYTSRTGTRRNLAALRKAGWRLLLSPAGVLRAEGFRYGLDNGKWTAHTTGEAWDEDRFLYAVRQFGAGADWLVVPDKVAAGAESLEITREWLPRLRGTCPRLLIAVQDGIEPHDVVELLSPGIGIFLGGSTEWKLEKMETWGRFCAAWELYYHVARVNSEDRIASASRFGAHSFDGSGAARFEAVIEPLTAAIARAPLQGDLLLGGVS